MGCSPPKELSEEWPLHWEGCNYIPEDLHPKSFRGYFGHNTNVWATHNTSLVQVRLTLLGGSDYISDNKCAQVGQLGDVSDCIADWTACWSASFEPEQE